MLREIARLAHHRPSRRCLSSIKLLLPSRYIAPVHPRVVHPVSVSDRAFTAELRIPFKKHDKDSRYAAEL